LGKRRKSGLKFVKPDDYVAFGPFEIARFGKNTIWKSHATAEQLATVQERAAQHFPLVVAEIDALVSSIAAQVARLPPGHLLQRGWWEYATLVLGIGGKKVAESDQIAAVRMVDYVQSVIAGVKPGSYTEDISEEDWNKLKADVATLFRRLTMEYQMCLTAHRRTLDPTLDLEIEEFRFRAETLWINVRGKRYQPHERQALLDVLSPHSDILLKLFGIDGPSLVNELAKVLAKLTRGLADGITELRRFQKDTLDKLETVAADHEGMNVTELMAKVLQDPELANRGRAVMGEVFGLDMFDVGKNTALPESLVDALSWSPGADNEFFAPGEFCGWPLRVWPIMKRPFIRLDRRVYCFDIFSLFDNLYRVLRRAILSFEPNYDRAWNDRQKAVSEELPFTYLRRLLPGAQVYRSIHYRWVPPGGGLEWYEADGLVLFDDCLFVVEVKAGAFTYTSPANDLQAHLSSLREPSAGPGPARQPLRRLP
jgi:preprotein translocase subunit SecA